MSKFTLEMIAKNDEDAGVRIAAIQQLSSEGSKFTLEMIAENDPNPRVREAAVRQLKAR